MLQTICCMLRKMKKLFDLVRSRMVVSYSQGTNVGLHIAYAFLETDRMSGLSLDLIVLSSEGYGGIKKIQKTNRAKK